MTETYAHVVNWKEYMLYEKNRLRNMEWPSYNSRMLFENPKYYEEIFQNQLTKIFTQGERQCQFN